MNELLLALLPNRDQVASFLRRFLTVLGAWAMQKGYVDGSLTSALVGAGVVIGVEIWAGADRTVRARLANAAAIPGINMTVSWDAPDAAKKLADDPRHPKITSTP